jgi:hypothetical protein
MNKKILINDTYYDLKLLSEKCDYFKSMYNFEQREEIDLSHRGKSYEIIIKILLDEYIYDEDYIIYIDEIMDLKNELMIENNVKIKSIEEMCNCMILAIGEIDKLNISIWRHQNNKLTKKQKNSEQYSKKYWKNIRYLDLSFSYNVNKNIYEENDSLKKDRYEGILNFNIIKDAYMYSNILKKSNYLIFKDLSSKRRSNHATGLKSFFELKNLLLMDNNFELLLENVNLNNRYYTKYDYNKEDGETFIGWINSNKIKKLYLINCFFNLEDIYRSKDNINLQHLIEYYIISNLPNLEHLEMENLKINVKNYHKNKTVNVENSICFENIFTKFDKEHTINYIDISDND